MCRSCDIIPEALYSFVVTDRGNFSIVTIPIDFLVDKSCIIPGIEFFTGIVPVGAIMVPSLHDYLDLSRSGFLGRGVGVNTTASFDSEEAISNHDRACMLASTNEFEWMTYEQQQEILYGFTQSEASEISKSL